MYIFEIIKEKKTNKLKIIINYPDKHQSKFIKSLQGAIYYYNTNVWIMQNSEYNIVQLKQNNYTEYIKEEIQVQDFYLTNNYIYILANNNSKYTIMKNYTFIDSSNCFQYGKYDSKKIKKVKMFELEYKYIKIPIGFKNDYDNYTDKRKIRKFKYSDIEIKNCLNYLELYTEQIEAVKVCFKKANGIIDLIGGLGKTEIFIALCKLMKLKTLIITESILICKQTYKRGIKAGLNIDVVQGENILENDITVCTIQSSHKLQDKYDMIIVDECHNIDARYIPILSQNTLYRFGFSATPFGKNKLKNAYIRSFLGDVIFSADTKDLIKDKKIAEPIINIIEINKPNLKKIKHWGTVEKLGIIHNNYRNNIIVDICKKVDKQVLILIKKIAHGKRLEEMLIDSGIDCLYIHGSTSKKDRQKVLDKFEENNNKFVLIGSNILKEGISIDSIFNIILAGGGQSYFDTMQSLYRGTRVKLKDKFNVYDFMDSFNYITLKHSKQRISDYKEKGFTKINIL